MTATLRDLLDHATTGQAPDDTEIAALTFRSGTVAERATARRAIRVATAKIAAYASDGLDTLAAHEVDKIMGTWGWLAARGGAHPAVTAAAPERAPTHFTPAPADGAADKARVAALRDLLRSAATGPNGTPPRPSEVARLVVRSDATEQQAAQWRREVAAEGQRIAALRAAGENATARRLADDALDRLAGMVGEPDVDDHADLTPRQLADLVRNQHRLAVD